MAKSLKNRIYRAEKHIKALEERLLECFRRVKTSDFASTKYTPSIERLELELDEANKILKHYQMEKQLEEEGFTVNYRDCLIKVAVVNASFRVTIEEFPPTKSWSRVKNGITIDYPSYPKATDLVREHIDHLYKQEGLTGLHSWLNI